MHSPSPVWLIALALALISGARPTLSPHSVHEKRALPPPGWNRTRRLDAAFPILLRIALKQKNIGNIDTYLYDVSHPRSPNYGNHWSPADIARTFAPSDESIDAVRGWLVEYGIHEERIGLARTKGWIHVNLTAEEAEQLMMTEYSVYAHVSGREHVACEVYHLPEHVRLHVDFVTPSVHFDVKLPRRSGNEDGAPARNVGQPGVGIAPKVAGTVSGIVSGVQQCDRYTTPACLRALYGLSYDPVATDRNSYGIVEYTPQAYLGDDLELFARNFSTDLIGKEPDTVSIDGGYVQTGIQSPAYNAESNTDLQYGMSLVTGKQTVTLYQTGDMAEGASFNNFLDAIDGSYCTFEGGDDPNQDGIYPDPQTGGYTGPEICGIVKPTYVISTSYGYDEADLSPFYAERQCGEYAKLGLMGITVLYSSGDHGVAGNGGLCLNPNGTDCPFDIKLDGYPNMSYIQGTQTAGGQIFNPTFPGTCPYITSVGATMMKPGATVDDLEMACMSMVYSGGGFSNYFGVPDYQKDAVGHYLSQYRPDYPSTIWNSTGMSRGFPDISANGANYVVVVFDGQFRIVYGTSCSASVSGAIFTMINDARLAAGKRPIGFVNPVIYSPDFSLALHDVTEGSNPGCGTNGYDAVPGWDPVTGLGTPNFPELLSRWLSLP